MMRPGFCQAGWVVDDLEAAMQHWRETSPVGPFLVTARPVITDKVYRGAPTELEISVALAQLGDIQVELIQQRSDGPSAYRDTYPPGKGGMHHLGGFTDDFDATLATYAKADVDVVYRGSFGDVRFVYFDTRAQVGHMTEYFERRPSLVEYFAAVADAARDWDGATDAVRRLD